MSRYNFHPVNRDQSYLLPPDLKEWLPEGDLAWFIVDATEQMDRREEESRRTSHLGTGWSAN